MNRMGRLLRGLSPSSNIYVTDFARESFIRGSSEGRHPDGGARRRSLPQTRQISSDAGLNTDERKGTFVPTAAYLPSKGRIS